MRREKEDQKEKFQGYQSFIYFRVFYLNSVLVREKGRERRKIENETLLKKKTEGILSFFLFKLLPYLFLAEEKREKGNENHQVRKVMARNPSPQFLLLTV